MANSKPHKRRGGIGLILPFILVGLLLAAYAVFWFVARGVFEKRVDGWIASERARGSVVDFTGKSIGGFPFRLALNIAGPNYKTPEGASWQGDTLQVILQPWNPTHIMFRAPGTNQATDARGIRHTFAVDEKSVGSVSWTDAGLNRAAVMINKGDLLIHGHPYTAEGLTVNFAPQPEARDNMLMSLTWRTLTIERAPPAALYLGNVLGESQIIGEIKGFYPALGRAGGKLDGVYPALLSGGGGLDIGQGLISWGPMKLGLKGSLVFAGGTANGQLGVRLDDAEGLKAAMQQAGNWGILEQVMFVPLETASRDGGFLPMDVVNSEIQIAGQRIGQLPKPAAP
jgi:Uncharacterized protein conserved in bacteria (DUF2125)